MFYHIRHTRFFAVVDGTGQRCLLTSPRSLSACLCRLPGPMTTDGGGVQWEEEWPRGGAPGPESTAEGWGLCSRRRGRRSGGQGLGAESRTGLGVDGPLLPPHPHLSPACSTVSPWCPRRPSAQSSWSPASAASAVTAPSAPAGSGAGAGSPEQRPGGGRDSGTHPCVPHPPVPPACPPASRSRRSLWCSGTARCCRCRPASR